MNADLDELGFVAGIWRGTGHGDYPTIDPFDYHEEIEFAPLGSKPVIRYTQTTRHAVTGEPLHSETGYLRPAGAGRVEMVIAQPTGIVEVHTGSVETGHLHLRALSVERTPQAVEVSDVERHLEFEGDLLRYRLSMAAVGHPLQVHLEATLRRA